MGERSQPTEWADVSGSAVEDEPMMVCQEDDLFVYGGASEYREMCEAYMRGRLDPPVGLLSHPYPAWVDDDGLVVDNSAGPIPRWW